MRERTGDGWPPQVTRQETPPRPPRGGGRIPNPTSPKPLPTTPPPPQYGGSPKSAEYGALHPTPKHGAQGCRSLGARRGRPTARVWPPVSYRSWSPRTADRELAGPILLVPRLARRPRPSPPTGPRLRYRAGPCAQTARPNTPPRDPQSATRVLEEIRRPCSHAIWICRS